MGESRPQWIDPFQLDDPSPDESLPDRRPSAPPAKDGVSKPQPEVQGPVPHSPVETTRGREAVKR
ncbi:MAG TPA: hypothetical protein VFS39_19405 [Nitrospira sp.]|nr:hypothetical protein [Nitrospira sp.]